MRKSRLLTSLLCLAGALLLPLASLSDDKESDDKDADEKLPTIAEKTELLEAEEGMFRVYRDARAGTVWLELPAPRDARGTIAQVLYSEGLLTGLGSNPVGLDRGQLGRQRLLDIRRLGNRVLFEEPNLRFRAISDQHTERRATRESFATSVVWATLVSAMDADGTVLIDLQSFLVRDAHGVEATLRQTEQGAYALDPERSAIDLSQALAFPDNLEFEALLTYGQAGDEPGELVAATAPSGDAFSLVQHHSLVRLPDADYQPRPADPRIGFYGVDYVDYAAPIGEPIERWLISRHRLEKTDPGAARSTVVEPIVYYVDPGAPEPIRSALIEGASWWAAAFEAAGFIDAYRVEVLPEGAHPLDVRYNVIQWVHRSTRGWSYGGGVVDPRTGEIIKGHVSLGSLRVRQDRLLFEGLLGADGTGSGGPRDPIQLALARIRQLSAHEVGHTLGLTHNFAASTYGGRASVMDYPAPKVGLTADGELDVSEVYGIGVGAWDVHTIRYGYSQFAPGVDGDAELAAIVRQGIDAGYLFLADEDARPPGASDPRANLWDNGSDAVDALEQALRVRRLALDRFGERNLAVGRPLAYLEEVLAPVYFHHRYQLEAAVKVIGGLEFHYALRGDGQQATRMVDAARQQRALDVILGILEPSVLDLDEDILTILPPRPFGSSANREMFHGATRPAFDALGAAESAAQHVLDYVLEPSRAARLVDFHRRRAELPSLEAVLDRIAALASATEPSNPRHEAIRDVVANVVVSTLIRLADNAEVPRRVRGPVEVELGEMKQRLASSRPDLSLQIQRFLERPYTADWPVAAPPLPPGSPIGQAAGELRRWK